MFFPEDDFKEKYILISNVYLKGQTEKKSHIEIRQKADT